MIPALLRLDTEDWLTPASDDAALWLARALERRGLVATFPLVARKLRALRERGREDVLAALSRHAVGYHSDTHSVHPTLAEELATLDWEAGLRRLEERESRGFALVEEEFGPLACLTQPGANWLPQWFPFARSRGVPLVYSEDWNSYIDFGSRPFWYLGQLGWAAPVALPKPFLSGLPANLDEALARVAEAARTVGEEGGAVNLVAHPTELVTEVFWDAVSYGGGRNPPPGEELRPPLRPPQTVQAAQVAFERFLEGLSRLGVEIVPLASWLSGYEASGTVEELSTEGILELAGAWSGGEVAYAVITVGRRRLALSAAEGLRALATAVVRRWEVGDWPVVVPCGVVDAPLGSWEPASADGDTMDGDTVRLPVATLVEAARSWLAETAERPVVPGRVRLGRDAVRPERFAVALARLAQTWGRDPGEPVAEERLGSVEVGPVRFPPARHVRPSGRLHWDWPVFPPGFAAPRLRQLAVAGTWSLKPALPRG